MTPRSLICACLALSACSNPKPTDPYAALPILGRDQLVVLISAEPTECTGFTGIPALCFFGVTRSGEQITFDTGITGYTYQPGISEQIAVERIRYDFSGPQAPQDISSYRYVLISK